MVTRRAVVPSKYFMANTWNILWLFQPLSIISRPPHPDQTLEFGPYPLLVTYSASSPSALNSIPNASPFLYRIIWFPLVPLLLRVLMGNRLNRAPHWCYQTFNPILPFHLMSALSLLISCSNQWPHVSSLLFYMEGGKLIHLVKLVCVVLGKVFHFVYFWREPHLCRKARKLWHLCLHSSYGRFGRKVTDEFRKSFWGLICSTLSYFL